MTTKIKSKPKPQFFYTQCTFCKKPTRVERCDALRELRADNYGNFSKVRSGKREDLKGLYVRSAMEANYCRYLNFLIKNMEPKTAGTIIKWEYEADTFQFPNLKKGTRFYTPDFKIFYYNGEIEYHETKGYMTQKSRTQLSRMAKHYPEIKIVLIQKEEYKGMKRFKALIPGWE